MNVLCMIFRRIMDIGAVVGCMHTVMEQITRTEQEKMRSDMPWKYAKPIPRKVKRIIEEVSEDE